nr:MAG TPA: protein of unknown function (DUF5478) [Caudoviricetes sp.]
MTDNKYSFAGDGCIMTHSLGIYLTLLVTFF